MDVDGCEWKWTMSCAPGTGKVRACNGWWVMESDDLR